MAIQLGRKIKGYEVIAVSDDEKVVALYSGSSLGDKGRIMTIAEWDYMTYANGGIPTMQIDGRLYKQSDSCAEIGPTMARFNWWTTSKHSAYSK